MKLSSIRLPRFVGRTLSRLPHCFPLRGGGKSENRILFSLALVLTLVFGRTPTANAQIGSTPFEVNCGQLIVEIVPVPYAGDINSTPCTTCCAGAIQCERTEYEVWLRAVNVLDNPLPPGGNFTLSYSELYITLHLDRDNNAVISTINESQTEGCLASYLSGFADDYQANSSENEVTLRLSSLTGEMVPGIPFVNGRSNGRLFSIIVDGFPGEKFGIACTEFTYVSGQDCPNQSCSGSAPAEFLAPNAANTALTLSLGDIDCDLEDYIDLPVTVTSSLTSIISLFDFAVVVNGDAPDGFYAEPEVVNVISGTNPTVKVMPKPGGGGYVVNVKYMTQSAAPFQGTDVPICTIRIYRPPNLAQGYTISTTLAPGRIRTNGILFGTFGCRSIQTDKTTAECVVQPVAVCADFQFNLTTEPVDPNNCSELIAYAKFSCDPADFNGQTTLDFEVFKIRLDFDLGNGVSILSATPIGFDCPSSGNDPFCGDNNCLQIGSNTIDFCVNMGPGNGIPVQHDAKIRIVFNAPAGCVNSATVRKMLLKVENQPPTCQPDINPPVGFPFCPPLIQGDIATELACWVENVSVAVSHASCSASDLTSGCNPFSTCVCSQYSNYTVTPTRTDNLLNGVTTFDLVLISKHIIGITPLSSPYKMIAADANRSNSLTTFDIVELRKLILGIYNNYDTDPSNNWPSSHAPSWRFVLESFALNPNDPWKDSQGNSIMLPESGNFNIPEIEADFVAIKTGDVNNSVIVDCTEDNDQCHAFERPVGDFALAEPRRSDLKAGDYYTLPVQAGGETPLAAWQTALRFDPDVLELVGPSLGDLPGLSADNFNLLQADKGIVRALWFAPPEEIDAVLQSGQTLFHLTFKVKKDIAASAALLQIDDDSAMPNLGWTGEGAAYRITTAGTGQVVESRSEPAASSLVRCRPNPSSGEVTFDIAALPSAQRARLTVLDAFGRRVWWRDLSKESGPLQIAVPEAAAWPTGVYHWELRRNKERTTGTFIRQ